MRATSSVRHHEDLMNRFCPIRWSRVSAVGVLLLAVAACNGLDDPRKDAKECTITITGAQAIAGTYYCSQPAVSIWVSNTNVGAMSLNISGTTSISGLFVFPGKPATGVTYSTETSSPTLQSYGFLVKIGASTWEFSAGQQQAPLGTGTLSFSSVVDATAGTTGTTYTTHGTIDATLVPSPGTPATGNATMHIDF